MSDHVHIHADGTTHSHTHSHAHTKAVLNRLSRAQGHLDAVEEGDTAAIDSLNDAIDRFMR